MSDENFVGTPVPPAQACPVCEGNGYVHCELTDSMVSCSECFGSGVIDDDYDQGWGEGEDLDPELSMDGVF